MTLEVIPTGASTATVLMSQEQVDALRGSPGMSRVPLRIDYAGQVFQTSVSRYRGEWMMVVNREMREGGLTPGASYNVEITLDTQERTVSVPDDLAAALQQAGLRAVFDGLSYTHRKEYVRSIEEAKKPETRARRIATCVEKLAAK